MIARPLLYLPVETKVREFHGKMWLALHLLEQGFDVMLGEQKVLWNYIDLLPPGIYLDKSAAATRAEWFERCRAHGHTIVAWDDEGLVFFDAWLYRTQRIYPRAFDQVSRFFAWGEVQREAICEVYPQYRARIERCGNPRFDFLRPELRAFYQSAVQALTRRFGRMILINTSFAFYNHFKSPEDVRTMMAQYPLADEPGYMDGWIAMHKVAHHAYLEMVPALLERYPEHSVVVRPHPSESHAPWLELAAHHPRLHVESKGNVHEWILAAEAIIHFNCTTAVEAFLLQIPPIAYRPGRFPRYENFLPNSLSENAFSLAELWSAIDRALAGQPGAMKGSDEQHRIAERYITGLSGPTSAARVCERIAALEQGLPSGAFSRIQHGVTSAKRVWRLGLHALREVRHPSDGYEVQKFPGMDIPEIRETLARMMDVSGINVDVAVRRYAKNCFWLSSKASAAVAVAPAQCSQAGPAT